jgi:hypothetical protein
MFGRRLRLNVFGGGTLCFSYGRTGRGVREHGIVAGWPRLRLGYLRSIRRAPARAHCLELFPTWLLNFSEKAHYATKVAYWGGLYCEHLIGIFEGRIARERQSRGEVP